MKLFAVLLILAMTLTLAACGGDKPAPADDGATAAQQPAATQQPSGSSEQTAPTNTPVPPTATPKPAPPTATPAPPTDTPAAEADEDAAPAALAALDALQSYRARITYQIQGTRDDGSEVNDVMTMESAYSAENDARFMTMQFEGTDEDGNAMPEHLEYYQIGTDMYMYGGEEMGWMRVSNEQSPFADPSMGFLFNSETVFSNLDDLKRERPDEEIAGIDSRHYSFDETAIADFLTDDTSEVKAEGEVWIAKDGDFVTKYILKIDVEASNADALDPTLETGTIDMAFELTEANTDIVIELPEEATGGTHLTGFEDGTLPMPDDAVVTVATNEFSIVQTDLTVEEAVAFYEAALQELGWTKDDSSSMSMGDMASLSYSKDGVKLTVLVQPDTTTGKTQVMFNAEASAE